MISIDSRLGPYLLGGNGALRDVVMDSCRVTSIDLTTLVLSLGCGR